MGTPKAATCNCGAAAAETSLLADDSASIRQDSCGEVLALRDGWHVRLPLPLRLQRPIRGCDLRGMQVRVWTALFLGATACAEADLIDCSSNGECASGVCMNGRCTSTTGGGGSDVGFGTGGTLSRSLPGVDDSRVGSQMNATEVSTFCEAYRSDYLNRMQTIPNNFCAFYAGFAGLGRDETLCESYRSQCPSTSFVNASCDGAFAPDSGCNATVSQLRTCGLEIIDASANEIANYSPSSTCLELIDQFAFSEILVSSECNAAFFGCSSVFPTFILP